MKNKILISFLFIAVVFAACEKTVNIEIPYSGDKLVVNSFISRDSLIYVDVSKSFKPGTGYIQYNPITGQPISKIPDGARVDLLEDDIFKETLIKKMINGHELFGSNSRAQLNKKYTLKVSANNLPSVEGSDRVPFKPKFFGVDFKYNPNASDFKYKATIKLKDDASEKNYYMIRIITADTNNSATGPRIRFFRNSFRYFRTEALANSNTLDPLDTEVFKYQIFDDIKFNGKEVQINISISSYDENRKYIGVWVSAITEATYRNIKSVDLFNQNYGNPFAEAVNVYTNIKNGYGIVGCLSDSLVAIRKTN